MRSHVLTEESNLGIQMRNMYLDTEVAHTEQKSRNVYMDICGGFCFPSLLLYWFLPLDGAATKLLKPRVSEFEGLAFAVLKVK